MYTHIYTFTYALLCFVTQSHVTLCYLIDCSLPGSSVHEFSRQEYWSGLPFPSPGDLPFALQGCIIFCYTAVNYIYTYMSSFLDCLPIKSPHNIGQSSCATQQVLISYLFIHHINSIYVSSPISQCHLFL